MHAWLWKHMPTRTLANSRTIADKAESACRYAIGENKVSQCNETQGEYWAELRDSRWKRRRRIKRVCDGNEIAHTNKFLHHWIAAVWNCKGRHRQILPSIYHHISSFFQCLVLSLDVFGAIKEYFVLNIWCMHQRYSAAKQWF